MSQPQIISGLGDVADRYDALLCDVWGVVHNGLQRFEAACEAMVRFGRERGPVVLISNAPRPAEAVKPQLRELGVPQAAWAGFVTSGDATVSELRQRAPGPTWAIGPDRDLALYEATGVAFAQGPQDAAFITCTGLVDDDVETPEDYRAALTLAAARNLPMVCANPDKVVHRGKDLIFCAGALADLYETLGGSVIMAGKPCAPIYRVALAEVDRQAGRAVDPARIICVGDGVGTDVRGANGQGLDCLFITGGIHGADLLDGAGATVAASLEAFLAREGASAAYALPKLVW
jgi:HAD superfamily hydrolase (TIGR01459 family)